MRGRWMVLLAVACVLGTAGCRRGAGEVEPVRPGGQEKGAPAPAQRAGDEPAAPAGAPAVTVNGEVITQAQVADVAAREQVSPEEALRLVVQAEVVAAEARRNDFPGAKGEDRMALARRYLETVYSQETLCGRITPPQIRRFYELSYRPDWPADVYRGEVIEVRCCAATDGDCPAAEMAACMARNAPFLAALKPVRAQWEAGEEPDLVALRRRFRHLVRTDFGFLHWPGIPEDKRKPLTIFDQATVARIRALAPGEVSEPFRSSLGYHLVRLAKRREAISPDSPVFARQARETLCAHRIEQTRHDYVRRLIEAAVIERH